MLPQRVHGTNTFRFERRDGRVLLEHVAQLVDAFHQALLGETDRWETRPRVRWAA